MSDTSLKSSRPQPPEDAPTGDTALRGAAPRPRAAAGKYLTFGLGDEVYGLEILKVQEIIGLMRVTRVPGLPEVIRGVVNLRGKVIPVVDLRLQFGMEARPDTERTCIVVVRVWRQSQPVTVGLIVDDVREVLAIAEGQMEAVPRFGHDVETTFLLGMAKVAQRVVMLLHVDRILTSTQLGALPAAEPAAAPSEPSES